MFCCYGYRIHFTLISNNTFTASGLRSITYLQDILRSPSSSSDNGANWIPSNIAPRARIRWRKAVNVESVLL